MVNYRRNFIPGGTYFFTVTLKDRASNYLTKYIHFLREVMVQINQKMPYKTEAIVVLPEHIHAVWTLPKDDVDYPHRWRQIKSCFTKNLLNQGVVLEKNKADQYQLWRSRFWEHTIQNEKDFEHHVNYIHYNPVKHGLVKQVRDWKYSSFHRYVKDGLLTNYWGSECVVEKDKKYGE